MCDTFDKGPKYACQCNNSDLFYILFRDTINKAIKLNVRWMPSHLDLGVKKWPPNVSKLDVEGNKFADKYAGEASEKAIAPLQVRTDVVFSYFLVKRIQKRIIAIIQSLPARQKKQTVLTQRELQPSVDEFILESKHALVSDQGRYHCKICLSSFLESDRLFKSWVTSACTGTHTSASSHSRPEPLHDNFIHIGNQFVHHTHKLNMYKGFVYCGKCGFRRGANQVRKLAKPCAPPGLSGIRTLEAIRDGKLPPGLEEWPILEEDDGFSSDGSLFLY